MSSIGLLGAAVTFAVTVGFVIVALRAARRADRSEPAPRGTERRRLL